MRRATIARKTAETEISVEINLDGTGAYDNRTGVGFFDHMLDQLARHALIDLTDQGHGRSAYRRSPHGGGCGHHAGPGMAQALGDKRGIRRYGAFTLVMDEARVDAALDLSARPSLSGTSTSPRPRSAPSTPSWCASSSRRCRPMAASRCTSRNRRASTATTSPRPRSRPSPARCARRWSPIRAARTPFPRPRARSEAMTHGPRRLRIRQPALGREGVSAHGGRGRRGPRDRDLRPRPGGPRRPRRAARRRRVSRPAAGGCSPSPGSRRP
jgi:hypothetical protein